MLSFGATILPDPPCSRFVELVRLAEECGFDNAWTYDSHVLWQDGSVFLPAALAATERIRLGFCVTNPGTREPTVSASYHATLNDMYPGRVVHGIGRGDSARRTIGYDPVTVGEFARSTALIRELMNGRPGTLNDKEIVLEWAGNGPEIPIYVAGYGPKVLAVAGREANGVIIQLADLDIIEWIMDQARAAAAEAGRDPAALEPIVCAPVVLNDDKAAARELVRWFPAMVSNHVVDLLERYDPAQLPPALHEYVQRRKFYDYRDHSRRGAAHGEFVDDETADRFSILGTVEQHVEKLKELEAAGVTQFNIYLMCGEEERIVEEYGKHILPQFAQAVKA
jgi:probable F420-dependent oxidoreductase